MMDVRAPNDIVIKTPFLNLAAKRWGDPAGLPVLGLHGWLDNAATFDHLAPFLFHLNFISLDLPGHGRSDHRPPGMKYHYIDYIADVIAVVDELQWEKFTFLGHSLGAGIASMAAGTIPERIHRLALIEGIGPSTRAVERAPDYLLRSVHEMSRFKDKKMPVYKDIQTMINARTKRGGIASGAIEALVRRGSREVDNGVTWRSDPRLRMISPLYMTDEQVLPYLTRITAPVLLILGEQGYLGGRAGFSSRCSYIKNLDSRILPGGHHLHLDHPEAVAEVVTEFLT